MKKIYTIILVINEDYDNTKDFHFEDFDEYFTELLKYTNRPNLKELGYEYNQEFKSPISFLRVTSYKNPTKKEIDYRDYQTWIQLKEI